MIQALMDFLRHLLSVLPFEWTSSLYMRSGLLALLFFAPVTALLGVHVTSFRMSFFSDAVSHSAFTGVALGLMLGIEPLLAVALFAVVVAVMVLRVERSPELPTDSVISVIMSAAIALGLVLMTRRPDASRLMQRFLFGDLLTVGDTELFLMALLCAATLLFSFLSFNRLSLLALHRPLALILHPKIEAYRHVFILLLSLTVASGLRVAGILLVTPMIVIPAALARLYARNLSGLFWGSLGVSLLASVTGLFFAYRTGASAAAGIVSTLSLAFFIALALRKLTGRLFRR